MKKTKKESFFETMKVDLFILGKKLNLPGALFICVLNFLFLKADLQIVLLKMGVLLPISELDNEIYLGGWIETLGELLWSLPVLFFSVFFIYGKFFVSQKCLMKMLDEQGYNVSALDIDLGNIEGRLVGFANVMGWFFIVILILVVMGVLTEEFLI